MLSAYREIFRETGAVGFASAGFVARVPLTMAPIGIVAMLSQTHGAYWIAGAVSATFALTNAVLAPQISRVVDRFGQTFVVGPATAVAALAFLGLVAAANQGWPVWTLFLFAFLAGFMPSIPAMVRARWSALLGDRPALATAYAFESAADELVYVAGASLSVALSVSLFPEAGMAVAALLLALGTGAFLIQRRTEPPVVPTAGEPSRSAIRLPAVRIVTLLLVFVGTIFSAAEITTVAVTEALDQPDAASLVIGVYAVGSFAVGLVLGALRPAAPLHRQLLVAVATVAATQGPLVLATGSLAWLAIAVFASGVAISPTFITSFGLIARTVPPSMLTEGVTWVTTGIGIGMALGAFATGAVVDAFGPSAGFGVSVAGGLAALATAVLGQRILSGEAPSARGARLRET